MQGVRGKGIGGRGKRQGGRGKGIGDTRMGLSNDDWALLTSNRDDAGESIATDARE